MSRLRWVMILREMWHSKARTLLVVLSISVGVFAIGTIANSWSVLIHDLNDAYLATNPASAVLIVEPFGDDLVSAVRNRRDVAQAEGRRAVGVKLHTAGGEPLNMELEAVEDFSTLAISRFTPESGVWPPLRGQLLVERSYARALGLTEGTPVTVEMPNGDTYNLIVAGQVHDLHRPPAGNSQIAYGYVSFDTFQWVGEPRTYNRLYLTVSDDAFDEDRIRQVVTLVKNQTIERSGYTVQSTAIPTPGESFLTVIFNAALAVLAVVGAFSLLLSGALVVNTISAVLTQQVRRIGVLKAIGGMRGQIIQIYLSRVAIYGMLALVIAVPLAAMGTRVFTGFFARLGNFDIVTTRIPVGVILLEVSVGMLVPLAASLIPVTFGTRITVREAITSYGIGDASQQTLVERLLMRVRGVPGTLALSLRNTFRRKPRLVLTLSTLTLAGAIFIAVLSVRDSLFSSFERALVYYGYDLNVDLGGAYRGQQLEREAERVPGVVEVEGWLQQSAARVRPDDSESANYTMIGVPLSSQFIEPEIVTGRWLLNEDRNRIVVNTDFLREEPDASVGSTIRLRIGDREDDWEIVGVVTKQYSTPVIYVGFQDLGRYTNKVGLANRVLVRLADRDAALESRVGQALEEQYKDAGLLVSATTTRSSFVTTFEGRFNFLIVFMLFLAVLLSFVGGLGLAGTMGLNVLERIREIGVMRAIGASNWAVQKIILSEGIVIGVMSWIFGAALAFPLSLLMSIGVGIAFGGEPLEFSFSFLGLALWLTLAVGIAAVSSYFPARNASRLTVREILTYE